MSQLIKCPTCNKDVSDEALSCPHCGQKLKNPPQSAGGILAAIIIGVIIGGLVLAILLR